MNIRTCGVLAAMCFSGCANENGPQLINGNVADTSYAAATADMRFVFARPKNQQAATAASGVPVSRGYSSMDPNFNICAEPSPDVAKALADAITASANVTADGLKALGGTGANISITPGFSSVQNASLTELGRRLATTQLLRDGVYRLCEAYANGAISSQEYALVLSRYGDTMVTLLAIEAVTGVADKLVSASAAASASAPPAVAPPAQKPQASNGTPDAKPTVNNAALRLHGHAGNTVDNAFDASFKRIAYAFLRDPLPMSVKAAAKPAAANGAGDQANSPDPASGAAPAGENADVVTAADAVVRLQENYLKQSAYAPLIVLCTQSLSGQLPDDSKNSIATNCTSVLASFVTIQSKKLQDEATRVTANQPNRPNQPVQKPPAHKPVKP